MNTSPHRQAAADYLAAMTDAEAAAFVAEVRAARDSGDELARKLFAAVSRRQSRSAPRIPDPEPEPSVPAVALNNDEGLRSIIARAFNAPVRKIAQL